MSSTWIAKQFGRFEALLVGVTVPDLAATFWFVWPRVTIFNLDTGFPYA